jgi:hypothetical protein
VTYIIWFNNISSEEILELYVSAGKTTENYSHISRYTPPLDKTLEVLAFSPQLLFVHFFCIFMFSFRKSFLFVQLQLHTFLQNIIINFRLTELQREMGSKYIPFLIPPSEVQSLLNARNTVLHIGKASVCGMNVYGINHP